MLFRSRERIIRLVAGSLVLISLSLGLWVHPYFFFITAFVGLNLFQSALTQWCLLEDILRWQGVPGEAERAGSCCGMAHEEAA